MTKKIKFISFALLLFALAVGVPGLANAAYNNVPFSAATTVVLTGPTPNITLTISASSNVNSIQVRPNDIILALERDATSVSSITFTSAGKYNLVNDGGFAITCGASSSSVTLTGPATVSTASYTLAPALTSCDGGGGGGGGGGSSTTTTTTTTPSTTTTTETTTTDVTTETTTTTDTTVETTTTDTTTAEATTTTELQLVAIPAVSATPTVSEIQAAIAAILNNIQYLQAQLALLEPSTSAGTPALCAGISFTRGLTAGSTGSDVKCMQALLNQSSDTQIASSGVGSPSNETNYFGSLTVSAVGKFQVKKGLVTGSGDAGYGYVGPKTRAQLNSLIGK